jgi:uncharacterized protein DUF4386
VTSTRKTALAGGVLYLITFIAILRLVLYGPVLNDPGFIVSSGSDTAPLWAAVIETIVALAGIGTAVALFPVVKRQSEAFALGFVASRIVEAGIIIVGIISLLSIVTLRENLGAAAGAEAATLVTIGKSLVVIQNWTFLFGQTLMPGVNALLLGYVMYRSGLVPRLIPALGLIGGPLMISSVLGQIIGINEQYSVWSGIALIPIFVWELSLGLYLTFKGFKPVAIAAPSVPSGASNTAYAPA